MKRKRMNTDWIKLIGGLAVAYAASIGTSYHEGHKQIWNETGDHFQDLVTIEQAQANDIAQLQIAVSNLQWQIKSTKRNK